MSTPDAKKSPKAANDNLTPLKRALLEWSERDHRIRGNAKSFLRLLASHADPDATVWILRKRFARILGVSVRSIATYTGLLQAEGLMVKIGIEISGPCAMFDVYRLGPNNDRIQSFTESGPFAGPDEERCSSDTESGSSLAAYREDSTDLNPKKEAEEPRNRLSADTLAAEGTIPAEIRAAFSSVLSADEMFSYVDSGSWHGPSATLVTRTEQGTKRLVVLDRGLAEQLGINIAAKAKAVRHG